MAVDPLCTVCLYQLSRNYIWAREWDKAAESRERFLLIGGNSGHYLHGIVKLMQGEGAAALEIFETSPMQESTRLAGSAMALHSMARHDESDAALAGLRTGFGEQEPALLAHVHAYRNEKDAAFEWLEKLLERPTAPVTGHALLIEATINPLLQNLYDDPRWEQFRMKVGIPTELIESLQFSIDVP